jgi:hypothetical protein
VVPVRLQASVSEVGTLELTAIPLVGDDSPWQVSFSTTAATEEGAVVADLAGAVEHPDAGGVGLDLERQVAVAADLAAGDGVAVEAGADAADVDLLVEPMARPTTA